LELGQLFHTIINNMQSAMIFLAQEWRKNDTNLNVKPVKQRETLHDLKAVPGICLPNGEKDGNLSDLGKPQLETLLCAPNSWGIASQPADKPVGSSHTIPRRNPTG
jgi:hypothetical protein